MVNLRNLFGQAERLASMVTGPVGGLMTRVRGSKDVDDTTVTRKVESVVFRDQEITRGDVIVNTRDGIVELRGVLKRPEQIRALTEAVEKIPEVRGVENLVTLPKTAKKPTPTTRFERKSQARSGDRVDELAAKREASPKEKAATGEGRSAAPLGSHEPEGAPDEHGSIPRPTV